MKYYLTTLFILFAGNMNADKYKILFINTPSVVIGNKKLYVNDTFDEESFIRWESQKQAMKVQNLRTKQIRIFTSKQFSKNESIKDFYLKHNHLSTRSGSLMDEEELRIALKDHFYLLDDIEFSTILSTDDTAYFSIVFDEKEQILPVNDGNISIKRELFNQEKSIYRVTIYYNEKSSSSRLLITDDMTIELLPLKIKN